MKRGFPTKREALLWEREFIATNEGNLEMNFSSFYDVYKANMANRLRQNTWQTKETIVEKKILPYFGDKQVCDIKPIDVLHWQNTIMEIEMKTVCHIHRCISKQSIFSSVQSFNHAVRFYGLHENPCRYSR